MEQNTQNNQSGRMHKILFIIGIIILVCSIIVGFTDAAVIFPHLLLISVIINTVAVRLAIKNKHAAKEKIEQNQNQE